MAKKKSRRQRGWSQAAIDFVDDKTKYLVDNEGMDYSQAYATAISYARREGYRIPQYRTRRRDGRRYRIR